MTIDERATKPPLVTVEEQTLAVHVRTGRFFDPGFGSDPTIIPRPAVQYELTDLAKVAGPQAKAAGVWDAVVLAYPFKVADAERLEQRLSCKHVDRRP